VGKRAGQPAYLGHGSRVDGKLVEHAQSRLLPALPEAPGRIGVRVTELPASKEDLLLKFTRITPLVTVIP